MKFYEFNNSGLSNNNAAIKITKEILTTISYHSKSMIFILQNIVYIMEKFPPDLNLVLQ